MESNNVFFRGSFVFCWQETSSFQTVMEKSSFQGRRNLLFFFSSPPYGDHLHHQCPPTIRLSEKNIETIGKFAVFPRLQSTWGSRPRHWTITISRWWFQIFVIFTPTWEMMEFDSIIFFSDGLVQPPTRYV